MTNKSSGHFCNKLVITDCVRINKSQGHTQLTISLVLEQLTRSLTCLYCPTKEISLVNLFDKLALLLKLFFLTIKCQANFFIKCYPFQFDLFRQML